MRKRSEVSQGQVAAVIDEFAKAIDDGCDKARREGLQIVSHHGDGPALSSDFERIVERVFDLPDALAQYDRLEREMKLGDDRTDYGALVKALDSAEDNARMAHKLYVNAKKEQVAFERDLEVFQAPMVADASAVLQTEKDQGRRNKAITDGDVQAKAAQMFPDAYREGGVRKAKVELMVKQTLKLCELWTQRCSSLQTLLSNRRR